jgi:Mu transposase, C-terminal domain
MSQQRLPMRKVRDVLRLKAAGLGKRKIAASLGISATATGACLRRARDAGIAWPLAEAMTEEALEAQLYPASVALAQLAARRPRPDWAARRLDRLTCAHLRLLRRRAGDGGLRQSQVRHHQDMLLRAVGQPHLCGDGGPLRHRCCTGAAQEAARQGQSRGGSAGGYPWIVAKLRNRRFFSLPELNVAITDLITALNDRPTRHLGTSRRSLFEELERSALKKLPAAPYTFAAWKQRKVGLDYHVEIEKHYYSVPCTLLQETVWARITARTVEVFHRGKRVAAHVRSMGNGASVPAVVIVTLGMAPACAECKSLTPLATCRGRSRHLARAL